MNSLSVLIMLLMALAFIALGVFLIPSLGRKKAKRKRPVQELPGAHKDWKGVSLRLEKHIYALRKEIARLERLNQRMEGELTVQKEKYAKAQEKLNQERGWKEKESQDLEKKTQEVVRLKKDLAEVEKQLAKEHGDRLRLERQIKEAEALVSDEKEIKRALEADILKLNAQLEVVRKEMTGLREINQKLSKKQDDVTWIAKSEYLRLQELLKKKEEEMDRFRNNPGAQA